MLAVTRISPRTAYAAIAMVAFGLIGVGLIMQHVVGLQPCPLCIFQRMAFFAVGAFAILAAVLAPGVAGRWVGVLVLASGLTGLGLAARHVWLQMHPESLSCGPGLTIMLENFPLTEVLPKVFAGGGDCAEAGWVFLGLSIAGWSLVWFVLLSLATLGVLLQRYSRP
jgi:protein dithiol:quinone oxidoreductase